MLFRQTGRLREWECCGFLWQIILSPLYPERDLWSPVCPACGEEGKVGNE